MLVLLNCSLLCADPGECSADRPRGGDCAEYDAFGLGGTELPTQFPAGDIPRVDSRVRAQSRETTWLTTT